jgi:hypothetical protein
MTGLNADRRSKNLDYEGENSDLIGQTVSANPL